MRKKILSVVLASVMLGAVFAGCGEKSDDKASSTEAAVVENGENSVVVQNESTASSTSQILTVGTNPGIHQEILTEAQRILSQEGVDLNLVIYEDYMSPNLFLENGDLDADFYQHTAFLEDFNRSMDTNLVSVGEVHFEPLGIYPGQKTSLSQVSQGDVVAIPEDDTNKTRALRLLENAKLISLKPDATEPLDLSDISSNPHSISILPMDASMIATKVKDAAYVVLNGNYARNAFFSLTQDALVYENAQAAGSSPYWNIVAVNSGHENDPGVQKLVQALQSDEIKNFINNTYDGTAITR